MTECPGGSRPVVVAVLALCVAATTRCGIAAAASSDSAISPGGPYRPAAVQTFIAKRCNDCSNDKKGKKGKKGGGGGGGGSAIWSYDGRLVDPNTGRTVAEVEGIELVRRLTEIDRTGGARNLVRGLRMLGDLRAGEVLTHGGDGWDYAATVLTRRMFVYRPPPSGDVNNSPTAPGDNPSQPTPASSILRSIRLRPNSPPRKLKLTESVALYDVATTYISRNSGRDLVVLTEFPDGRWIMGRAEGSVMSGGFNGGSSNGDDNAFDYAVFARMGDAKRSSPTLPALPNAESQSTTSSSGGSVSSSPPRSKLVQFGKDNSAERARFGVRETYSYAFAGPGKSGRGRGQGGRRGAPADIVRQTFERIASDVRHGVEERFAPGGRASSSPSAPSSFTAASSNRSSEPGGTVRYTRHGESPPWYRPTQPATLELRGKQIPSVEFVGPAVAGLAGRCVPGFLTVDCGIPTGEDGKTDAAAAARAVEWFRSGQPNLLKEDEYDERGLTSYSGMGRVRRLARGVVGRGADVVGRIRDATALSTAVDAAEL